MSFFSIRKFLHSLKFASRGLVSIYKTEQNFRFQILASLMIIVLMFVFELNRKENVVLIIMITLVLLMEIINSVFEKLADMFKPRIHVYAEVIKDLMAGAVLLSSVSATIIGLMIFIPYFKDLFGKM
ncbi:diacylglycerol kinase family protein [bacterium]|nr:diacylglycerol kinase family protein [bacterium]